MSETWIFVIAVVVAAFFIIAIYNGIIQRFNRVHRAWADVLTQERAKNKIIPNLESLLDRYNIYEDALIRSVTDLREGLRSLNSNTIDTTQISKIESATKQLVGGINLRAENYPELKASELFQNVMREIANQQDNIAAALRAFNFSVEEHNAGIEIFPNNIVNAILAKKARCDVFNDTQAASGFDYSPNV